MTRAPAQRSALCAVTTAGSSRPEADHNGGSGAPRTPGTRHAVTFRDMLTVTGRLRRADPEGCRKSRPAGAPWQPETLVIARSAADPDGLGYQNGPFLARYSGMRWESVSA